MSSSLCLIENYSKSGYLDVSWVLLISFMYSPMLMFLRVEFRDSSPLMY